MNMALQDLETCKRNMLTDADLRFIQAKALVVCTTKDPSGPVDEGRRIASLIPNARLAVIENYGHWRATSHSPLLEHAKLDAEVSRARSRVRRGPSVCPRRGDSPAGISRSVARRRMWATSGPAGSRPRGSSRSTGSTRAVDPSGLRPASRWRKASSSPASPRAAAPRPSHTPRRSPDPVIGCCLIDTPICVTKSDAN